MPDPTPNPPSDTHAMLLGWRFRALVQRYHELARRGWESDDPEPDAWSAVAADVMTFRATLPDSWGSLFGATSLLERAVNQRLDLERSAASSRRRKKGQLRRLRVALDRKCTDALADFMDRAALADGGAK